MCEPGLRVIKGSGPKPWDDRRGFIEAVVKMSHADLEKAAAQTGPVFFDRGIFDALSGLAKIEGFSLAELMPSVFPYAEPVFFAPPWPEIFEQNEERPHSFEFALEESERLKRDLNLLAVKTLVLPKLNVDQRVAFVMHQLSD